MYTGANFRLKSLGGLPCIDFMIDSLTLYCLCKVFSTTAIATQN